MSSPEDDEFERRPDGTEIIGESFDIANHANIPVNVWLGEEEDDETLEETGKFKLTADNYMPRKGFLSEGMYEVRADTPEPLRAIVKEKIIPLYEVALSALHAIADGTHDNLYYWDAPSGDDTTNTPTES